MQGQSAVAAFQADIPLGGAPAGEFEGRAIVIATILRQAVSASDSNRERDRLVREAARLVKAVLGKAALARGCAYDPPGRKSDIDALRLLAEQVEQRGHLNLAGNILESLASAVSPESLTGGRILSERARNSWKGGELDLSEAQHKQLRSVGRKLDSAELCVRAMIGRGAIAQIRGNRPAMRGFNLRAARLAERRGLWRLAAQGHMGLSVDAGMRDDFSRVVAHLWRAFGLAARDLATTDHVLANLAYAFLKAGHPAEARSAAARVLIGSPRLRFALPALGSYACASAALDDAFGVRWAADQVTRLAKTRGHAREVATAMQECGRALAMIGVAAQAAVLRRRAVAMAHQFGFHDIAFEAEQRFEISLPATVSFDPVATEAAAQFSGSAPTDMPAELVVSDAY